MAGRDDHLGRLRGVVLVAPTVFVAFTALAAGLLAGVEGSPLSWVSRLAGTEGP
jgi:hypothetical protein